jgi:antitoxin (DNA-binding transcriptional repressor) of toxin-antitoxin stability system
MRPNTPLQILAQAEHGEDVVTARDGTPVARLVPIQQPPARPVGFVPGAVPDVFFDPLPESELELWE